MTTGRRAPEVDKAESKRPHSTGKSMRLAICLVAPFLIATINTRSTGALRIPRCRLEHGRSKNFPRTSACTHRSTSLANVLLRGWLYPSQPRPRQLCLRSLAGRRQGIPRRPTAGRGRDRPRLNENDHEKPMRVEHKIRPRNDISPDDEGAQQDPWGENYVHPEFLEALKRKRIFEPTEVQKFSIPAIANGTSVVVQANTGSGKTLAFLLPFLTRLLREHGSDSESPVPNPNSVAPKVIIVTPSPELCVQILSEIEFLLESIPDAKTRLPTVLMTGVGKLGEQLEEVRRKRPLIVIGTPKQLLQALKDDDIGKEIFSKVDVAVVDEADRVLKPLSKYASFRQKKVRFTHGNPTEQIVNRMITNNNFVQLCFLSATVNSPLRSLFKRNGWKVQQMSVGKPFQIPETINHFWVDREGMKMSDLIVAIIQLGKAKAKSSASGRPYGGCVLFAMDFIPLATFKESLESRGLRVEILHTVAQHDVCVRNAILERLESGSLDIIIATEANSRGLDFPNLSQVILTAPCFEVNSYIHLAGRTGRQGLDGEVWNLFHGTEEFEAMMKLISYLKEVPFEMVENDQLQATLE